MQKIRISLSWLASAEGYINTDIVTDYDLFFKKGNNTIATSCSGGNNIEFIEKIIDEDGYYKISIQQFSERKNLIDFLSYSWYIE